MKSLTFYEADDFTQIVGDEGLGLIVAGASDVPKKFSIKNVGDEAYPSTVTIGGVGASDGQAMLRIGLDTDTLSPPWGIASSVSASGAGGGWGATGTYEAVVTALNADGETVASDIARAIVVDTTQVVTWSWEAVSGATGYNVYRRLAGGSFTTPCKIADDNASTSFDDDGSAPSSGAPPDENTTGGAGPTYGTPPTMGLGPVSLAGAPLAAGRRAYAWASRVVVSGTTAQDNTRFAAWDFT